MPPARRWFGLLGWLVVSHLAAVPGLLVATRAPYDAFERPAWSPPGWVFGPVWTVLYVLMGVAAWLVWREGGWARQRGPLSLFLVQLALNALWTPLFFGAGLRGWAFAEILVLWAAILATLLQFRQVSRTAAWLLVPYLAWVTFAAALTFAVWRLNA
jgi:translocator protein